MEEEKTITEKPKKLWDGALKMVKGENPNQLIEQFTAEMTLVAEGLCEDQTKLRREVDDMMTQEDRRIQKLESRIELLEIKKGSPLVCLHEVIFDQRGRPLHNSIQLIRGDQFVFRI